MGNLIMKSAIMTISLLTLGSTITASASTSNLCKDSNRLENQGYNFVVRREKYDEYKTLISHKAPSAKSLTGHFYSKHQVNEIINNKIKFKIIKLSTYRNSLTYKIKSKSGKIVGYINFMGVRNVNSYKPSLQKLIKEEVKEVKESNQNRINKNKLIKLTKSLSPSDKKIAINSINELITYSKTYQLSKIPSLLQGIL